ncbi:MAG: VOC family protein [Chloroflexota bacterium]
MNITAFRHIGLTVTDLDRSTRWYTDLLGFRELFRESQPERRNVILHMPGTEVILGLVQFPVNKSDSFSPRQTGLDHLCFAVSGREELESWITRLDDYGVAHSGVVEMATSPIINFKDPDGIALAVALPPRLPQ